MPNRHHLPPSEEKSRYDLHENSPDDPDYRAFLSQLFEPMLELLNGYERGLDFGSGPGPTLSVMFEEKGFEMTIFDIFYHNKPAVLNSSYHFITATEVFEHLAEPRKELERLWKCLKPGGFLGIMTKRLPATKEEFDDWHYRRDDTHITFYADETFEWIAQTYGAEIVYKAPRVIILQKEK